MKKFKNQYVEILKRHYDFDLLKTMSSQEYQTLFTIFWSWDLFQNAKWQAFNQDLSRRFLKKSRKNELERQEELIKECKKTWPQVKHAYLQEWIQDEPNLIDTSVLTNDFLDNLIRESFSIDYYNSIKHGKLNEEMHRLCHKYFRLKRPLTLTRRMKSKDFDMNKFDQSFTSFSARDLRAFRYGNNKFTFYFNRGVVLVPINLFSGYQTEFITLPKLYVTTPIRTSLRRLQEINVRKIVVSQINQ